MHIGYTAGRVAADILDAASRCAFSATLGTKVAASCEVLLVGWTVRAG